INNDTSSNTSKLGDQIFNKAICLALEDTLSDSSFEFRPEEYHPKLRVKPDIIVETQDKIICLEVCYTKNTTPGYLANYVLKKLNIYMKQVEAVYQFPEYIDDYYN
ncbi:MAG: hypothetical protein SAJ12_22330, partial [Jaaginema sp. PMC 1079.18]|nr:hypothetical protein [Jaaginema sp. PMC 1079.18]